MAPIQMYVPSPVEEQVDYERERPNTERNRENDLQATRAATFTEDADRYKIIVDVQDYLTSGVRFDVVNANELIIEGCAENDQEGSVCRKSFYRRFLFPSLVRVESVSSMMSSDGILTITVAKAT